MKKNYIEKCEVAIIGGGIMGATLASLLQETNKDLNIHLFEKLNEPGEESSKGLNNAGTGHAGFCELNYTPQKNGTIDISKALEICEMYEQSLQYWAYLAKKYKKFDPKKFISKSSHSSLVWTKENINFLNKRFQLLKKEPLFSDMKIYENIREIEKIYPLLTKGRTKRENLALTNFEFGTDVNFGMLTKLLIETLNSSKNFLLHKNSEIVDLIKHQQGTQIKLKNGKCFNVDFLFIGAGGRSISLLQKLKIKNSKGYGGFPISGKWLISKNKNLIKQHKGKVYGQAEKGAPPMSIPHLDIRKIDGKDYLMFGPFAGFTTKFLNNSSFLDLLKSIKINNLKELLGVCFKNLGLLKYLINQSLSSKENRMKQLRKFYPFAKSHDWHVFNAGKRVQIIKPYRFTGKLQFGTEVIYNKNYNIAALLGASPGASVSVSAMLEVVEKLFETKIRKNKISNIIPSYKKKLNKNPLLLKQIRKNYRKILQIG